MVMFKHKFEILGPLDGKESAILRCHLDTAASKDHYAVFKLQQSVAQPFNLFPQRGGVDRLFFSHGVNPQSHEASPSPESQLGGSGPGTSAIRPTLFNRTAPTEAGSD